MVNIIIKIRGGITSTRAKYLGVEGVVIEGNYRDIDELNVIGLPVFAKNCSTLGAGMFVKVSEVGKEIVFGADTEWPVTIKCGDIIVADSDGCVCVPLELVDEVVKICEELTIVDSYCLKSVQDGISIKETFAKYR
jgi:regulator of RNase E activity RraA